MSAGVPPAAAGLRVRGLGKRIPEARRELFSGLDLDLAPGDYVAIQGESGTGKSTLLNLLAGLDRPDQGSIVLDGHDYATLDDDGLTRLRRSRLGFVFQAFHVLPYLSLAQNVELPLSLNAWPAAEARARVAEMLDAVGLGHRGGDLPGTLSGGELQRVAIARALAHRPRLILADEPTGNLDPDNAGQVLGLLRLELERSGAMGLLVTHSAAAAASAARRLVLGVNGLTAP